MSIRSRLLALLTLGMLGCAFAGCASSGGTTTRSRAPVDTRVPLRAFPLVPPTTQARVQVAVGDPHHAMLLANGMTRDHRTEIDGATVVDGAGATTTVSLPELESATLVPWARGYAVGGAHCLVASTEGVEHECIDWIPTVAFLHPDGSVVKVVTGTEQKDVGVISMEVRPADTTVFFKVVQHDWETVDESGFSPVPGAQHQLELCRTFDGAVVGARTVSSSADLNQADDVPETEYFSQVVDGRWTSIGEPAVFDPTSETLGIVRCTVGGIVTTRGSVLDGSGLQGETSAPEGSGTVLDTAVNAVGFDASGRLYVSFAASEGRPPQVLGGPPSVTVRADDRWAGLSADGRYVLLGGPHGSRIVPT